MASTDQSLQLSQRLGMRLSAQQLRFVRLLEYNAPELEEAVERELDANPALDGEPEAETPVEDPSVGESWYGVTGGSGSAIDYDSLRMESQDTLYASLSAQLRDLPLSPEVMEVAEYIVGSLDPDGYLRRPLSKIIDDLAFGPGIEVTDEVASEALRAVRSLDPPGVGASDLQDCLRLQLERKTPSRQRDNALEIVDRYFDAFIKNHTHRIVSGLKAGVDPALEAIATLRSLNPKPGNVFHSPEDRLDVIVPDFTVTNVDGKLTVAIENNIPELRIEQGFEEAVKELSASSSGVRKGDAQYVMSRYNDAREFIRILAQRQRTLMKVMTAIVDIQKEYFLTEDVYRMRPMMIKDIAARTGLDMSVISRATANKYVATEWGIFPLRHFFSDNVGEVTDETLTNRQIEAAISSIIENEDKKHPLSDDEIQKVLVAKGYQVSRRTVNKYRGRKGIPPARLRKSL